MADYLIEQYNAKIQTALEAKQTALIAATQLWHKAVDDIVGMWQAATVEAAIEMSTALEHRNRVYVEGPPPEKSPEPKQPEPKPPGGTPTIDDDHSAGAMAALIEAEGPPDDHSTD